MGRAERNGQSYGIDRNHGDGEVLDHDIIHLDKKFQEKKRYGTEQNPCRTLGVGEPEIAIRLGAG